MRSIRRIAQWLVVFAFALLWLVPLLWVLSTSFKPESQVIDPVIRWIPRTWTLDNYVSILQDPDTPVLRWFGNSAYIAVVHVGLLLLLSSLAAFAYARLRFRGREAIFWLMMFSMMVPGIINFVPTYLIVDRLGWLNTGLPMIVPGLSGVFGIFLLRQFMAGIPKDLDEAAMVDGAGPLWIYWRVVLPLAKPALATLAIFSFLGNWNDFMWPLIVTDDKSNLTITAGLALFKGKYHYVYGKLMAGAILSALPPLAFFLLGQRHFVKGIALSGIKG